MPPRFVYQNILDIRHTKVEAIEIQLGRIEKKLLDLEDRRVKLINLKSNLLDEMEMRMKDDIDLFRMELLRSDVTTVDEYIEQTEAEIEETRKKAAQIRKNLVEARQAEETLEILKEKGIEKFNAEMKRIENSQQDDVYISLAYKNHQQGV